MRVPSNDYYILVQMSKDLGDIQNVDNDEGEAWEVEQFDFDNDDEGNAVGDIYLSDGHKYTVTIKDMGRCEPGG